MTAIASKLEGGKVLTPAVIFGFLVLLLVQSNVIFGLGLAIAAAVVVMMIRWPEIGTLAVLFVVYANLPIVLATFHNVPTVLAASVSLLLAVPLVYYVVIRKEPLIVDRVFVLMVIFLGAFFASAFFAKDFHVVMKEIGRYLVEGMSMYFLLVNVIRSLPTLKHVICALLLAGSLMGGLSIYQEATHTWNNNYAGMAQRGGVFGLDASGREDIIRTRSAGPIGEQNRYAQILVVLLPLAWLVMRNKGSKLIRLCAAGAGALVLGGVVLSFSRGAFVGMVVVFIFAIALRFIKMRYAVAMFLGFTILIITVKPDYLVRLASLGQVPGLFSTTTYEPDPSVVNRYAENLAAWHVFCAHPILGVGPGQFAPYYSENSVNRLGITEQATSKRGHNLYLEMAAEMGATGLTCFLLIVGTILLQLWRARKLSLNYDDDLASFASAFILSVGVYLMTAVFLQLSYQRYFWMLMALACVAARLITAECHQEAPKLPDEPAEEPQYAY